MKNEKEKYKMILNRIKNNKVNKLFRNPTNSVLENYNNYIFLNYNFFGKIHLKNMKKNIYTFQLEDSSYINKLLINS
jgi:hypothetical protein